MTTETDPAAALQEANDQLSKALAAAFRYENRQRLADIRKAMQAVRLAERAADRAEWRAELYRDRAHDLAVAKAQRETKENLQAAAVLRGDVRVCTKCGLKEGDIHPNGRPVRFYENTRRPRTQCRQCESVAGAAYRERKRKEAGQPARHLKAVV